VFLKKFDCFSGIILLRKHINWFGNSPMFKEYIAYIKNNPEGYWFKAKLYGWGWTPATWQGWLLTICYAILITLSVLTINKNSPIREIFFTFILPSVLLTFAFIRICYRTGEKPRWQWGVPKK
jgi:hypothetical protein